MTLLAEALASLEEPIAVRETREAIGRLGIAGNDQERLVRLCTGERLAPAVAHTALTPDFDTPVTLRVAVGLAERNA